MSDRERLTDLLAAARLSDGSRLEEKLDRVSIVNLACTVTEVAGFGDVAAARREALEEVRSLVNRFIREWVIYLASAGSAADLVAARVNGAKTIELEIQNFLDKPATDWRALAEKLAGALTDMSSGLEYIRQHYGALSGVGWDRMEGKALAALKAAEDMGVKP